VQADSKRRLRDPEATLGGSRVLSLRTAETKAFKVSSYCMRNDDWLPLGASRD